MSKRGVWVVLGVMLLLTPLRTLLFLPAEATAAQGPLQEPALRGGPSYHGTNLFQFIGFMLDRATKLKDLPRLCIVIQDATLKARRKKLDVDVLPSMRDKVMGGKYDVLLRCMGDMYKTNPFDIPAQSPQSVMVETEWVNEKGQKMTASGSVQPQGPGQLNQWTYSTTVSTPDNYSSTFPGGGITNTVVYEGPAGRKFDPNTQFRSWCELYLYQTRGS